MAEQKQTGVENIPESSEARQQDAPVSKVCCVVVILRGLGYFADLRTCGPTNGYFADRKMRTLFADWWVKCGPADP